MTSVVFPHVNATERLPRVVLAHAVLEVHLFAGTIALTNTVPAGAGPNAVGPETHREIADGDIILDDFPDVTRPCSLKQPLTHSVTHHIVTCGPPVTAPPCRLFGDRLAIAEREFDPMLQLDTQRTKTKRLTNVFIEPAASVFLESRTTRFGYFEYDGLVVGKMKREWIRCPRRNCIGIDCSKRSNACAWVRKVAIEELSALERVELVNNDPVRVRNLHSPDLRRDHEHPGIRWLPFSASDGAAQSTEEATEPAGACTGYIKQLPWRMRERRACALYRTAVERDTEGKRASAQTAWRGGGDRRVRARVIA
ncbi:hypothetical protein HPB50_003268 [Hyalomma asiaticum]|uniref:Uncharacterized protein n=1 Tax=Hyalomma asiaticum TaxID=266040 RepID=A0ACB7RXJ6_HYAAI|nr:hypothetical protein HPB50_003268 [Hyalomma asiaticum]